MKIIYALAFVLPLQILLSEPLFGQPTPSPSTAEFCSSFAQKFAEAEKNNATAVTGINGWLFLSAECRFLSVGSFWGEDAAKVNRSPKPEAADPIPAIIDFQQQLKARGIELLLVPVPPKAAIYPEKLLPGLASAQGDPAFTLTRFYDELRAKGVDVLDLTNAFRSPKQGEDFGPVYCKTDTHWSGCGCVLAAQAIAQKIRAKIPVPSDQIIQFTPQWKEISVEGDLPVLLPAGSPKVESEKIRVRMVSAQDNKAVTPDANSPVLVMGDSHTLVFHEFLGEKAGLIDQLAAELQFAPDLLGIRGSGATQVRKDLYRRSVKDKEYLAKKKVVVWCFTAREFTEADQGWQKLPVAK